MTDPDRLDRLQRQLAPFFTAGGVDEASTPACLDDSTLAALVDGTMDPAARAEALGHLATCGRCRRAVASVARALADPPVRAAITMASRRRGRRIMQIAIPLAAAALLAVVLWRPGLPDNVPPPHRGNPTANTPVAMSPIGVVADARVLSWKAVPGADRYRVTVFDAQSRVIYSVDGSDTLVALPDSTLLVPGQEYIWMVEARTGWDRWTASAPVTFTIAPNRVP